MAFLRRINQSKLQFISNQYGRFFFQAPYTPSIHQTRISVLEKPLFSIEKKPSYFYCNVRFFAAPFQAIKNKKDEPSKDGTRLNEKITARVVRLVTEDGQDHSVVPIQVALEQARKLDLDLVEVQRNSDPPVCRLMDFHQKRYKQRVWEKERAKAKSGESVKKGECKEVRFTEKIEGKDLKTKAESIIRLMERGYRVKCMAMGKGKEDEDEDLGGLLSRLTDLIEDVSIVESGPRVERKQAYVIVRHVKFPTKKGGRKTSKVVGGSVAEPPTKSATDRDDSMESEDEMVADGHDLPTSSPMQMQDENVVDKKTAWSVSDFGDDFNGGVSSNSTRKEVHATQQRVSSPLNDYASPGTDNRYKRSEPRTPARSMEHLDQSKRESIRSEPQFPYPQRQPPQNMGQSTRDSVRSEPQFPYLRRQPPQNMDQGTRDSVRSEPQFPYPRRQPPQNMGQSTRESVRSEPQFPYPQQQPPKNDASQFRNSKPPSNDLFKQQQSQSNVPGTPAPSFGIFSTPKTDSSGKQGIAADAHGSNVVNRYGMRGNGASRNLPGSKFDGNQRPDGSTCGQDKFGIFGRDTSNMTPNRMPKSN